MAVVATDNFNRANGAIGSNWATVSGWDSYVVSSNAAAPPTVNANCYNLWAANTIADDQYAQVTILACATSNNDVGVGVLLRAIADASTRTFYSVYASNHGTFLSLYVSSVHNHLVDTNSIVWSAGDVLWMGVVGTVITLKQNGTTVLTYDTASDATRLTSGRVGITYSSAADAGVSIDDFEAGDFSVTPTFQAAWARASNVVVR
jgi:hypothetical protein